MRFINGIKPDYLELIMNKWNATIKLRPLSQLKSSYRLILYHYGFCFIS